MKRIVPIIMAGGVGSRLWPTSTPERPKQFIPLKTGGTTFDNARCRSANRDLFAPPVILCAPQHQDLVKESYPDPEEAFLICEPVGRNTAPACCTGALVAQKIGGQDVPLLILPADHYIPDIAAFENAVKAAHLLAEEGYIVTFGIKPEFAHTQYGYIEKGAPLHNGASRVTTFTEKPDVETAEDYLRSGRYLWNSGIFMARADCLMSELTTYCPDIVLCTRQAWDHPENIGQNGARTYLLEESAFAAAPKISFDYAVMERTHKACVLEVDFLWRDMGGWDALMEFSLFE